MAVALASVDHSFNFRFPTFCCSSKPPTTSYRPAVILPGLGNNSGDYHKLELTLKEYGVASVVAKVSRLDWLRNAAGLVDPNYWRGTLTPRPVLDWPPPKGMSGVIDQTRGLLDYVEKNCSKAVYTPQLKYVCIAGRYIQGARLFGNSNVNANAAVPIEDDLQISEVAVVKDMNNSTPNSPTFRARFIGQGYKQVCGQADVWGDGVVPEASAHLEGALNVTLDGVYHSPVGSDDVSRPWYGSPAVVEQWVYHLLS
ncbi:hypothetical protein PVL29_019406 [Vitis rotundifolia]|uniref:Alpha/beta-Hydrolases superfamily protein n=1 Tax=Vitis rotundifolia TaxID=103349 RepID=A0AA39DDV0_VITRO|nr:hypothetical protein PVL29_019406 [Vitis rotundifolia]